MSETLWHLKLHVNANFQVFLHILFQKIFIVMAKEEGRKGSQEKKEELFPRDEEEKLLRHVSPT